MSDAVELLSLPFAASLLLVAIHASLGLQVLARRVIFVDLALAQIAALGATVAFMLGHPVASVASYGWSALFTLLAAMLLAATRQWSRRIPQEALIGVVYVVAAAAAFLLVDRAPQGTEHIKQILTGNILTVTAADLRLAAPLYLLLGALLWLARRPFAAPGEGLRAWLWDFLFYACFGLVVTSSVALAGVLLVFAFLIAPAAIGILYFDTPVRQLAAAWTVGAAGSLAGLAASYAWDLPTGAAMVCVYGLELALAGALYPMLRKGNGASLLRGGRWAASFLLLASGIWFAAAPRGDQPLVDVIEYAVPALRGAYMTRLEETVYKDTDRYAERYRNEAERLNEREARSRWQGEGMSDEQVARASSLLRSYSEMRKGELFVQREVRARARERARWPVGLAIVACGLVAAPWRRRK